MKMMGKGWSCCHWGQTPKLKHKCTASRRSKWVFSNGSTSLVDNFCDVSTEVVDFLVSTIFQSSNHKRNYLIIQDDNLIGNESSVDFATKKNLQRLAEIGTQLLEKPVSRVNLKTGRYKEIEDEGINAQALTRLAKLLPKERKFR